MESMLDQLYLLLNSEMGSFAYHFVLAFSIVGALALTMAQWELGSKDRRKRVLLGLSLLFGMQLFLFLVAGLTWQRLIYFEIMLPFFDRSITLLSLLLIVWLWCFPHQSTLADLFTLLIGILIFAVSAFAVYWWYPQADHLITNGSLVDMVTQVISILFLVIGIFLLLIYKPEGQSLGISMLFVLLIGVIAHLLLLTDGENYPTLIRLTQITAFPFLLLIPQSIQISSTDHIDKQISELDQTDQAILDSERELKRFDSQFGQDLLSLFAQTDSALVRQSITSILARSMQADICLLLDSIESEGEIRIIGGYNLHEKHPIKPFNLRSQSTPILLSALKMGRIRRISADSDTPDAQDLMQHLNIEKCGNMLIAPILSVDGTPEASYILCNPYSQHDWSADEISHFSVISKVFNRHLKQRLEIDELERKLSHLKQNIRLINEQARQALDENQKLRDTLAVLEERKATIEDDFNQISSSQKEKIEPQESMKIRESNRKNLHQDDYQGELRLALEEIAYLQSRLLESEKGFSNPLNDQEDSGEIE
jgi:hypothetical protein